MFDAKVEKERIVKWIREWFDNNGKSAKAVIGISGGKDSTIVAALCVEALGKNRVVGVLMPNGEQADIDDSLKVVEHLNIEYHIINIREMCAALHNQLLHNDIVLTDATIQNIPPRARMTTLYAIAQSIPEGGRVANTCNWSEDFVGYSTKYGDSAGDFAPLGSYVVREVLAIGDLLDIPTELVHKTPSDGLCGKSDEDNLGFTYAVLDKYIREGICEDDKVKENIDKRHRINKHKLELIPKVTLEN
jgi:NAD+ synthase